MKGLRPSMGIPFSSCSFNFYLVTWMKGLRQEIEYANDISGTEFLPCDLNEGITTNWFHPTLRRSYLQFLPCDLNEGITTFRSIHYCYFCLFYFYLVTWMKGLRLLLGLAILCNQVPIFTLWPEWRDYDQPPVELYIHLFQEFLPCDLNEGITTNISGLVKSPEIQNFYLVTWMKGLRP